MADDVVTIIVIQHAFHCYNIAKLSSVYTQYQNMGQTGLVPDLDTHSSACQVLISTRDTDASQI